MRGGSIMLAVPLFALSACGGAGPQTVGSIAPPAGSTGAGTGTGGSGTGAGTGTSPTPSPSSSPANFLQVADTTEFNALGAMHSLAIDDQNRSLYRGNASTVKTPSGKISYSPRDGVFTISFVDTAAGISREVRYQDPQHRDDYNPEATPQLEVPLLPGFNYLSALDGNGPTTFFYQRPNATTYVTLAGFAHTETTPYLAEHGVFAFGQLTPLAQVPISGKGTYTGGFLASAVLNSGNGPNYFQWMSGSSAVEVDFSRSTVGLTFDGAIGTTFSRGEIIAGSALVFPSGTVFKASGTATIDLLRTGGFTGAFTSATIGGTAINFKGVNGTDNVAGASSVDGAFFGPNAVNVGGNFRIVGGVPGQRIDVQGAFTGAKK